MNIATKVDAAEAAAEAYATPLAELNPARVDRFQNDHAVALSSSACGRKTRFTSPQKASSGPTGR